MATSQVRAGFLYAWTRPTSPYPACLINKFFFNFLIFFLCPPSRALFIHAKFGPNPWPKLWPIPKKEKIELKPYNFQIQAHIAWPKCQISPNHRTIENLLIINQ